MGDEITIIIEFIDEQDDSETAANIGFTVIFFTHNPLTSETFNVKLKSTSGVFPLMIL